MSTLRPDPPTGPDPPPRHRLARRHWQIALGGIAASALVGVALGSWFDAPGDRAAVSATLGISATPAATTVLAEIEPEPVALREGHPCRRYDYRPVVAWLPVEERRKYDNLQFAIATSLADGTSVAMRARRDPAGPVFLACTTSAAPDDGPAFGPGGNPPHPEHGPLQLLSASRQASWPDGRPEAARADSYYFGSVGPDVARVVIERSHGPLAEATVANGWFLALWRGWEHATWFLALDAHGRLLATIDPADWALQGLMLEKGVRPPTPPCREGLGC